VTAGEWLPDAAATARYGARLAEQLRVGDVVLLRGELGAGKTSLVRATLAALGLHWNAPSPSYAIVLSYEPPDVRLPLMHVDLYRLRTPAELEELGLDDTDGALLVEWPERAGEGRWTDALVLRLVPEGDGRRLTWEVPPSWEGRWPPRP
jgi:tRNA threonylcarbamoyladenosine biosynthesis protein TsaE